MDVQECQGVRILVDDRSVCCLIGDLAEDTVFLHSDHFLKEPCLSRYPFLLGNTLLVVDCPCDYEEETGEPVDVRYYVGVDRFYLGEGDDSSLCSPTDGPSHV